MREEVERFLGNDEKHKKLHELATFAIKRLEALPQPVVRVSGPLTSGGFGYKENLRRFLVAQDKLRTSGYTVFDYFEGHDDESTIASLDLPWIEVMEHYHRPILKSGLLKTVFTMPRWEESNGARYEHAFATKLGLDIIEIPEDWFDSLPNNEPSC